MCALHLLKYHCTSLSVLPHLLETSRLEWVGAGSPPGEEEGQADGLEDAGEGANGNSVQRALLGGDLSDELGVC